MTETFDDSVSEEPERSDRKSGGPIIVGVGASAASPRSLERFLQSFAADPQQALVVVLQHREALDEKHLLATLRGADGLELITVADGTAVEGGRIYLCMPDMITTISSGRFAVRPAEQQPGSRGTVDSFLVSLAEDRGEEAVGVILHGTGGDGTLAVAALKDNGGLAIAERPQGDAAEHLETGETAASLADFVLQIDDIAEHVRITISSASPSARGSRKHWVRRLRG